MKWLVDLKTYTPVSIPRTYQYLQIILIKYSIPRTYSRNFLVCWPGCSWATEVTGEVDLKVRNAPPSFRSDIGTFPFDPCWSSNQSLAHLFHHFQIFLSLLWAILTFRLLLSSRIWNMRNWTKYQEKTDLWCRIQSWDSDDRMYGEPNLYSVDEKANKFKSQVLGWFEKEVKRSDWSAEGTCLQNYSPRLGACWVAGDFSDANILTALCRLQKSSVVVNDAIKG